MTQARGGKRTAPGRCLGADSSFLGTGRSRARLFLTESGFPRGLVSDSNSMLGRRPAWMTNPYSEDLQERALRRADAGETVRSIAEALQISPSCISKWKKLRRETGSLKPGKMNGHKKRTLSGANADWLRQRIRSGSFTLRKLTAELAARGIKTDPRAVWVFVHAEGLSFKKTNRPAEQDRPD